MFSGFTRQETLQLTGLTSNQLSYLDKLDLVVPNRSGHPKHPIVIFAPEQILEIQLIKKLRERISIQETIYALELIREERYNPRFFKMQMLYFNSRIYWVKNHSDLQNTVVDLTGKSKGQLMLFTIEPLGDVVSELWERAANGLVLDFEKRVQGTILEAVKKEIARR